MKLTFKDYFSAHAEDYSKYRPTYPDELFSYLASMVNYHETAWDCATGNGQSALLLADSFSKVIATDASATQIENATQKNGIEYRVANAEESGIESHSVDLITVAQAFHWFDHDAFSREVDRVLKTGGIIAIWTYNLLTVKNEVDEIINYLYGSTLGEYWAFERTMVENGYKDIQFPYHEIQSPVFHMSTEWNFSQLIGYLCTWSAVKKYQQTVGVNPVETIHEELLSVWGKSDDILPVKWPLSIRLWQK